MNTTISLPSKNIAFALAAAFAILATALLFTIGKPELIPQLWISILAALLSYWACIFTADKLRLDLFDRRFEVYSKTLTYCSTVFAYASLVRDKGNADRIDEAIEAAHNSFRGIGIHKTQALFGNDIVDLFKRLNDSYAYIEAFGGARGDQAAGYSAEEYYRHIQNTVDIASKLPSYFRKYIYFGDHKLS